MGYLLSISAAVLWGLVQIPIKMAKTPARVGLLVSVPTAVVVLSLILAVSGRLVVPDLSGRDWLFILLSGLFHFTLASVGYLEAVQRAGITTAAPITRLTPIIVVLAESAITRAGLSPVLITAAALTCVGGVFCARGAHRLHPVEDRRNLRLGMLLAMFACFMWASGYLTLGRISEGVPRSLVVLYSLAFGTAVYWVIALVRGRAGRVRSIGKRDLALYAIHGTVSYAFAYWALFEGINLLGVSEGTVIGECWPAFAVLVGISVFREPMNVQKVIGIALLIGSAFLVMAAG